MKIRLKTAGQQVRDTSGIARSRKPTPHRRPFDPVAYAAALEMLG